jgi:hypothetical protein
VQRHEGKRALVRAALANAMCCAGEAGWPERLGVDLLDFRVVRRVLRLEYDVGKKHGKRSGGLKRTGRRHVAAIAAPLARQPFRRRSTRKSIIASLLRSRAPLAPNAPAVHQFDAN